MSTIISPKISYFENYKKQFDFINEELNDEHIFESHHLFDRIYYLINYNKQLEIAHNDINNKYQALLELQIKRETIKRYEQELQSMKYLFEITLKEKQIQNDQLQHERQCKIIFTSFDFFFQVFQTENNVLIQLVIRERHKKSTNQLNSNILQDSSKK
ncbi:unnamed protein product [Adineta steineri]|nr:unnamed protein product [Adineta steineri]